MLERRRFLRLAAMGSAFPFLSNPALAEDFPTRPVHMIVGFPPGGVGTVIAQLLGRDIQERLGQPIVIDNRPGAGGNIGTDIVVKSRADGYTLIWAGTNNAVNASLYKNLTFDFLRDIAMVSTAVSGPLVMAIHPSLPMKTVAEFIAYAKANEGKLNMASSGNGTSTHLSGELFKMMAGISLTHVPYRGEGPAIADLVAGQVQVMFVNLPSSIGYIKNGQLRALGVTTKSASPALPSVPPIAQTVPGYEATAWYGVGAPKATPKDVIEKLNKAIAAGLANPDLAARLIELGATPFPLSPADSDAFVAADTEKWAKVVKFSGAKIDL